MGAEARINFCFHDYVQAGREALATSTAEDYY
jgi:hypothetical protein